MLKGDSKMFSDEILEKIFGRRELQVLDLQTQSDVIHAIEEVRNMFKNFAGSI